MNNYRFTIYLNGDGETMEEGWRDAVEGFTLDPGEPPQSYSEEKLDDCEDEEKS